MPLSGISDHSKIITIFKSWIPIPTKNQDNHEWIPLKSRFKWDNKNRKKFAEALNSNYVELEDIKQRTEAGLVNSTGEKIQNLFMKAASMTLDTKYNTPDKNWKKRNKSKKWFDQDCQKLKQDVRKLGRRKHSDPYDNLLRVKYHEKLREFKGKCRSKRFLFWQTKFNEIEESLKYPKTFWKNWKNASEIDSFKCEADITGDQWFDHFSNLHTEKGVENIVNPPLKKNISNLQNRLNEPFSIKEFMNIIKNLKNDKASGNDSICNEMLKHSPKEILKLLLNFINLCLREALVPNSWCLEVINPIFKDGSINDPNNYRGICLSSALLKVICSLLNNRIQRYCTQLDLINKNQIGFICGHRTSDHLLTLKTLVKKYVTLGKKKLFACFVDFKKAFDSVWHRGLFSKVADLGIFGNSLDLIKNIYKKTKCAVKIKNHTTKFFNYTKGVRQGCPLSPVLFNLYINDIFGIMDKNNASNIFLEEGHNINALMYADDLILLSDTKDGLQNQINKLNAFCVNSKLEANVKKTKIMIFNRGNKLIKSEFYINNKLIENVKTFKYLGFTISAKNCSFTPAIEDLSIKANRAIFSLNNKIKLSKLPTRLALKIFQSQISPILLYGCEVWGPYMDYDLETWEKSKIEQVHVQFLKRILGCNFKTSNIMTRGEVGVRPLIVDIIKRVLSYTKRVKERHSSTVYSAFKFESSNVFTPNFNLFISKFNINQYELETLSRNKIKQTCNDFYDRYWWIKILDSPKATSYASFKNSICLEKYLHEINNHKHKVALSRFRLSNHNLLIEKGRHMRPRLERNERKCFICKEKIENEMHFLTECPLYKNERAILYQACRENSKNFTSLTKEQKFIFIMTNECANVMRSLGKFVFESFKLREIKNA